MAEPRTGVSYVMPVLNEAGYVESAIRSILEQDYAGPVELVLALGPSHDGTREIVERMAAADARIRVVENPGMDIPIGLNLAIKAAKYPVHHPGRRAHRTRARLHHPRRRRPRAHRRRQRRRHHGRDRRARVPGRGRPRVQQPLRTRRRRVPRQHRAGRTGRVGVHGRHARRRARRGRRLRRDPAPRRGLGAQLPLPPGRQDRLARPGAAGQLLAAQHAGQARAAVPRDRHLARRAGAPPRVAQLAAVLRAAGPGDRRRCCRSSRSRCTRPACCTASLGWIVALVYLGPLALPGCC